MTEPFFYALGTFCFHGLLHREQTDHKLTFSNPIMCSRPRPCKNTSMSSKVE